MRTNKYKVWDKFEQRFVCCHQQNLRFALDTGQIYINGTNFTEYFELCQYTGLTDKNGLGVYEGDIIELKEGLNVVVSWNEQTAAFCTAYEDEKSDHLFGVSLFPVIGNIYENPELVGGKD